MKTITVQTDTTGAWNWRGTIIDREQPHLMRLAWIIDDDGDITQQWCRLIKPRPDWQIDADAIVANGILPEVALGRGVPMTHAMSEFVGALDGVHRVVAFNVEFHGKILQHAAFECGLNAQHLFNEHTLACAMRRATDIVCKPRMAPGGGYSWPKLWEAYEYFTGEELPPLDLDPVERGTTLARCVYQIDQGILAHQKGVSHE
jgi:hypothetical protein